MCDWLDSVRSLHVTLPVCQGHGLYIPPAWLFAQRIVGSDCWVGFKVGLPPLTLKHSQDLKILGNSWAQGDAILQKMLEHSEKALVQPGDQEEEKVKPEAPALPAPATAATAPSGTTQAPEAPESREAPAAAPAAAS